MSDAIIVVNAGSSSLKFSVYEVVDSQLDLVAHGQIEGLGTAPCFKAKDSDGASLAEDKLTGGDKFRHAAAFAWLAQWLHGHYRKRLTPIAVGHRVVHGGLDFVEPTLIDDVVLA